ncbi:MAG: hypothetical protein ACETVY_03745 [Candidatus Bathyarchaeia archaeon]
MTPPDEQELWREADTIVIGTVSSITEEKDGAYTYLCIIIDVERYLKNPSESLTVVVRYYGRFYGGERVPDSSTIRDFKFDVGEKVLVYLTRVSPDYYFIYANHKGIYSIINGKAIDQYGQTMNIPPPPSTMITIGTGVCLVMLIIAYYKRERLLKRFKVRAPTEL